MPEDVPFGSAFLFRFELTPSIGSDFTATYVGEAGTDKVGERGSVLIISDLMRASDKFLDRSSSSASSSSEAGSFIYCGSRVQKPPLPGSSFVLMIFLKHLFNDKLCLIEFCNANVFSVRIRGWKALSDGIEKSQIHVANRYSNVSSELSSRAAK